MMAICARCIQKGKKRRYDCGCKMQKVSVTRSTYTLTQTHTKNINLNSQSESWFVRTKKLTTGIQYKTNTKWFFFVKWK